MESGRHVSSQGTAPAMRGRNVPSRAKPSFGRRWRPTSRPNGWARRLLRCRLHPPQQRRQPHPRPVQERRPPGSGVGMPDFQISIDDMVTEGDKVAVRTTGRGTHPCRRCWVSRRHRSPSPTMGPSSTSSRRKGVEDWEALGRAPSPPASPREPRTRPIGQGTPIAECMEQIGRPKKSADP